MISVSFLLFHGAVKEWMSKQIENITSPVLNAYLCHANTCFFKFLRFKAKFGLYPRALEMLVKKKITFLALT